jgi:RecB family exonuclease
VERAFGRPEPLEIAVGRRSLYVRGQIDRIDVDGSLTVIRDLKTARARPRGGRENAPDPVLDVQLAVYALAVERLAASWQLPGQIGGAYSYVNRGTDERDWRSDFDRVLKPAAEEWMALATDLLETRAFPRTPKADDCTHCRFRPVCGDGYERARELLAHSDGVLARFAELKPKKDERNG